MTDFPDNPQAALLEAALALAPFEGWTDKMLRQAEGQAALPQGGAALYAPDGPLGVIRDWSAQMDASAADEIAKLDLGSMKIRERVTQSVLARLSEIGRHEEAARRASARLSLPDGLSTGTKALWASADMIWASIGDTSTDANYYSKRAILSGVIASTTAVWLGDNSADKAEARAFLDRRIANVMQFEKLKWQVKSRTKDWPNPAEILGEFRYGTGLFGLMATRQRSSRRGRRRGRTAL